jgi:hypothetical protein
LDAGSRASLRLSLFFRSPLLRAFRRGDPGRRDRLRAIHHRLDKFAVRFKLFARN